MAIIPLYETKMVRYRSARVRNCVLNIWSLNCDMDGVVAQGRTGKRRDTVSDRLLDVRDLTVSFHTSDGVVEAVRGVSFGVDRGKTLGIVGESGSGKSVATQTVAGLTRGARVSGRAVFEGRDLLTMPLAEIRAIRGPGIANDFPESIVEPASVLPDRLADH